MESDFESAYTGLHSRDVVQLSVAVAEELGLSERQVRDAEFVALLHDVGKIRIPSEIINKPGKLTDAEWALMTTHTIEGQKMLDQVGGLLGDVGRVVRSCHERWDGKGYPDGLAGAQIPVVARIVMCCDAFSAMTTDRSYRKALTLDAACAELPGECGQPVRPRGGRRPAPDSRSSTARATRAPRPVGRLTVGLRPAAWLNPPVVTAREEPRPDTLAPEVVAPHLHGRFGEPYLYEPECESTQALLLGSGLPEGAVAATEHQTAGRGRLGRVWEEPAGTSILVSTLLQPPPSRHLPELSLVAALATAEAVEDATDLTAQIKWPNDVMLNRRKAAGILSELADGDVVVGIGINVNQTRDELPRDLPTPAASLLTQTGRTHDRAALLGSLLLALERAYDAWRGGGLDAIYAGLGARDFLRGRRVTVDGEAASALQILRDGRLEIELDGGEVRALESGEVVYVA
jgi:biotin-[acetyl-CoA-carboxylase] ligase BirA-like protein